MPSNIFRSNSLSSKALGSYVREVGKNYLKLVLGDLLDEIITDKSSLEIDPEYEAPLTFIHQIVKSKQVTKKNKHENWKNINASYASGAIRF